MARPRSLAPYGIRRGLRRRRRNRDLMSFLERAKRRHCSRSESSTPFRCRAIAGTICVGRRRLAVRDSRRSNRMWSMGCGGSSTTDRAAQAPSRSMRFAAAQPTRRSPRLRSRPLGVRSDILLGRPGWSICSWSWITRVPAGHQPLSDRSAPVSDASSASSSRTSAAGRSVSRNRRNALPWLNAQAAAPRSIRQVANSSPRRVASMAATRSATTPIRCRLSEIDAQRSGRLSRLMTYTGSCKGLPLPASPAGAGPLQPSPAKGMSCLFAWRGQPNPRPAIWPRRPHSGGCGPPETRNRTQRAAPGLRRFVCRWDPGEAGLGVARVEGGAGEDRSGHRHRFFSSSYTPTGAWRRTLRRCSTARKCPPLPRAQARRSRPGYGCPSGRPGMCLGTRPEYR